MKKKRKTGGRAREGKRRADSVKLNSLVDRQTIEALYRASQAGAALDLMIRGIAVCVTRFAGISENIRVLCRWIAPEHSRILVFRRRPQRSVSQERDWMPPKL